MSKPVVTARNYELTYLIPTGYTDTELTQIKKEVEALAKKHGGSVVKQEDWGKKPLAYRLKQAGKMIEEASYFFFELSFEPEKAQAFERDIYLFNKLVRHLFVLADNESSVSTMSAVPAHVEAATE